MLRDGFWIAVIVTESAFEVIVAAPNFPLPWAVFVTGPYGIRIEYVEHKPGFALK